MDKAKHPDQMVVARIEFKKEQAFLFCPEKDQCVIEMRFESPVALIKTIQEFEDAIVNCTVQIAGKIIDLRSMSGLNAST